MSLTHALKWSFLSELASKLIQPLVFVVLARLLTPDDFGVMSAALMVMAFSQIFWEAGMGKALIQRQTNLEDAANVAFWVNLGLALLIAGLLYIGASTIALTFFQDPRVTYVIHVMIAQVFLGAIGSVQTALMQKEMGFKKLFLVRFATVALPGFASIPLAWQGMGYWALVAGTLVGQIIQVGMLWRMSPWRPNWSFNIPLAKEMGRFGSWVGLSGLLAWFYAWADAMIVGTYLGSRELGLYTTGNQVAAIIFSLLFAPIAPVLYSYLSRMNGDRNRLKAAAEKILKLLTLIAVPVGAILFSISEYIGSALFGDNWQGIGLIIGVMAIMHGFSWVVGMNGEFYRSMGKPAYETIVTAGLLLVYLGGYLVSIDYGLEFFVWMRLVLALLALLVHLFVLNNFLQLNLMKIFRHIFIVSLIGFISSLVVYYFISSCLGNVWAQLLIGGLGGAILIGGILFILEKDNVLPELLEIKKSK